MRFEDCCFSIACNKRLKKSAANITDENVLLANFKKQVIRWLSNLKKIVLLSTRIDNVFY